METRSDLKYSDTHEWVKLEGRTAWIGITDFAQHSLGDIVFVELPAPGKTTAKNTDFGIVESVKAVSDLVAPLSGKVTEANRDLEKTPESLNTDPYGNWIIKLEISNESELGELMSEAEYIAFCEKEA